MAITEAPAAATAAKRNPLTAGGTRISLTIGGIAVLGLALVYLLGDREASLVTQYLVSGLLLGAGLAIEDKGHLNGMNAENDLKVGLMGPISGIGDVFIWILPMTILGSIAGYMAQQGSPVGILLWLAVWIALYFWRMQNYVQGYKAGASVVTKMGDKLNVLTDAASILGLTVVGSLIYSAVKISTPLTFTYGEISLGIQEGVLDQIFPNLLAVLLAVVVYKLIKKGVKLNWIILGILVVSCVCAGFGILAA